MRRASPALFGVYPELADDSFGTIGLDGPADLAMTGAEDPGLAEDSNALIEGCSLKMATKELS